MIKLWSVHTLEDIKHSVYKPFCVAIKLFIHNFHFGLFWYKKLIRDDLDS